MSKDKGPRNPAEWRELLKTPYEYPEEIETAPKRSLRRRARKVYRQGQKVEVKRRLAEERRREPVTAGGAILVIAGFLALGAAATHWWPAHDAPARVVQPGTEADTHTAEAPSRAPGAGPAASPSPSGSAKPDLGKPEKTAEDWARAYWARNPPVDKTHKAAVDRAAPWMTSALRDNLRQFDDKAWGELVSNGGVSTVDKVTVGPADDDRVSRQADTPTRVWRKVTVDTTVAGYRKYTETKVLLTEIMRGDDGWRVGRILGV
ncbi:hypothetical protein ACH427_13280 [Streptomyces sp. NPDC020379]|uniref:hypothetical protein n=1 Tax=Streptomyces sp. NPDC020379 TaxID=3365071 RepID=UPI0037AB8BB4